MARPADALPPLREDLQVSRGAPLISGAPAWVIYDPIRHRFFQIGQHTIDILARWCAGTSAALRDRLWHDRAIRLSDTELQRLLSFLRQHELLVPMESGTAAYLTAQTARKRAITPLGALQRMIFFRVPLLRPERFLQATLPLVRPLMSTGFVWLSAAVLLLALYLLSRQYSDLRAYGHAAFTAGGLLAYALPVAVLKMLHELGHAYQAVKHGVRVPVMGLGFMALFPLLYTDVSDGWRLQRRREKVLIDAGGVMTEIAVAVYATLLWCFLPDGALRTAAFAVATTGWAMSLLVNLNPLMRFDGYYLLADCLGIQNLQTRAFALGRWALRRGLFGLDLPLPEALGNAMTRGMILYAFCVWSYRLILFLSIALLLYTFLFKALAWVFLMGALLAFIGKPVLGELSVWYAMRRDILRSRRSWASFGLLLFGLGLLFWPMPTRISVPAVLEHQHQRAIFPPADARLAESHVVDGMVVAAGDVLLRFVDPELPIALDNTASRIRLYETRLLSAAGDAEARGTLLSVQRLLDAERQKRATLQDRAGDLVIRAAGSGVIRDLARDLHPGMWVARKALLGRIVTPGAVAVRGLIREVDRDRLDPTRAGRFVADDLHLPVIDLSAIKLSDYAVARLPDGYFATSYGGGVPLAPQAAGALVPRGVWYPLQATASTTTLFDPAQIRTAIRGKVVLRSRPEAVAQRIWRRIATILIRESGF